MSTPAADINDPMVIRQDALKEDGAKVRTLTLNRPKQYNPLSADMLTALQTELETVAGDESVRLVVLAAEGKAFCAGHDLKQMRANRDNDHYQNLFKQCSHLMQTIVCLPQPVIARVQGIATAAGCQLVASCDLAVASEQARFAVSGINVGLFCSTPGVALSRNVLRKHAFDMLITGRFIDATTAVNYGLINAAVPEAELDTAIANYVDAICSKSAVAVRTGKQMFQQQLEQTLEAAYDYAGDVMACNMMAEDAAEGIDAFIAKREPQWRHR